MTPVSCCIGIAAGPEQIQVLVLNPGGASSSLQVPASAHGVSMLRGFLRQRREVRLAIAGVAAVTLALALGSAAQGEVFIVSSAVASQPLALAQFASRTT